MLNLNLAAFAALNAGSHPQPAVANLAIFAAVWLVFIVPALLLAVWFAGTRPVRRQAIAAGLAACVALLLAQLISSVWYSPRPFAIGLGTQLIPHAADGSFPSNHMTFVWSVASALWLSRSTRALGIAMAIDALLVAWGRVYAGVHWPLDMLGGMFTGTAGALLVRCYGGMLVARLERIGETLRMVVLGNLRGR
ncbi:undecaprenyl-diphosphatase [Burkholderia sp. A1]|uniref:undecaprenyl-diphosphatase n=1 Tax=Burkholderia sp. A1 TaxID=148446 RepID=UPI00046A0434|nr:undecaprenyl-diphosphatase [Burkholderia sp. A1]